MVAFVVTRVIKRIVFGLSKTVKYLSFKVDVWTVVTV
jgi:hypothetical protein